MGVVRRIGIRASTVRTFSGAEVIVPNGDLLSGQVTNWTLSDVNRRLDIDIGVAYGTDPRRVIELLKGVAEGNDRVLKDPEPAVIFMGFGDSALNFQLRAWTDSETWFLLKSDLTVLVHDAIVEAGIVIPFPQRDLHIKTAQPPGTPSA
jgi:small-conductance mechanosensitive channel